MKETPFIVLFVFFTVVIYAILTAMVVLDTWQTAIYNCEDERRVVRFMPDVEVEAPDWCVPATESEQTK